ncbi:MAG: hypothetical protein ACE5HL_11600 [Terriglobia bacterium]
MKLVPNIGPITRVSYVVFGVVLIGLALWAPYLDTTWSAIVGVVGAIGIAEGAVGF